MERLWHSTRKMKPPVDQVVVGCWIDADDVMFVSLCFLDDGTESSLTNFEFEVRSLEFIGELSAVLAFLPVKTDFAENVVYITP